jgi:hypothetical protein
MGRYILLSLPGADFRFWCSSGFLVAFTRRMIGAAILPRSQGRAAVASRI